METYTVSFMMNGIGHCNIVKSDKEVQIIEQYYMDKNGVTFVSVKHGTDCVKPGMPVIFI